MNFRDGLMKLADEPPASKVIPTKFGPVKIQAPLAGRVDEFRKALGDKAESLMGSQGALVALACLHAESGVPLFGPGDIEKLNQIPSAAFVPINEAISEVAGLLSLDPTTTETGTGSGSVESSESPSVVSETK